jgi:3-oxoadipate enol-lactonase
VLEQRVAPLLGISQFALGFLLFMAGARLIPVAESSLIGMLETVLGPIWVWLALNERPGTASLAGGGLILAALLANTLADLVTRDARAADGATLVAAEGGHAMPFMVKDDVRLYYEDTGGNAPALLFLHGAGGNHLSWWQQVPVFAEEYRCVTVDQRGFGLSPDVTGGPGPAALATDALALLDHLGIARAALVAQSMGGWAAVGAAVRAPERLWAVAMANTVGNLTNPEIAAVRQRLAAGSPPRPAVLWHAALGETFRKAEPVRAFLYAQIAGTNAPLPADFRDQLGRLTTPVERYAATRVPTLFLTSDEDGLIWPELSAKVHEHVPGSRFVRVDGAGHSTYFERPEVFNREVGAFLKAHRP